MVVGAAVATIKRNAQGVVTGFRDCKITKPGDSIMRRYEVQVRLTNDGSSVYLYPDQLNVLGANAKQNQQLQAASQRPLLPANDARTLDTGVVNAAVRFLDVAFALFSSFHRCATLPQLSVALAPRAVAARCRNCTRCRSQFRYLFSCWFVNVINRRTLLIEAGYPLFRMTTTLVLRWTRWSCFFARTIMCSFFGLYLREVTLMTTLAYSCSCSIFVLAYGYVQFSQLYFPNCRRLSSAASHFLIPVYPHQQLRACSQSCSAKFQCEQISCYYGRFPDPSTSASAKFSRALVA